MTKLSPDQFYPELIKLIQQAEESVTFYSISCCFGFYSTGLHNFEKMYRSFRRALGKRRNHNYLEIRALIKVDRDNPIDMYAAERLVILQGRFLHTLGAKDRIVFHELPAQSPSLQFVIVDNENCIESAVQDEHYNEDLDLVLNKRTPGLMYSSTENAELFNQRVTLFEQSWGHSVPLTAPTPVISKRKLKHYLDHFICPRNINSERELQLVLMGYLSGRYDASIVDMESALGATRIDLLVGERPFSAKLGIEVKFQLKDDKIDDIVGQIRNYRKEYNDLMLVVGKPSYSAQRRKDLLNELSEVDVSLVELR